MFVAFGVAKNLGFVTSGAGGGGGVGGGGGARAATAVGATILDMLDNPALVKRSVISVVSVTINFVSIFVVSDIVVASTVNSTFKTESTAESFLRAVTSVKDVIDIAPKPTPRYSDMPVLNAVCFSSSNSTLE